MISFLLLNLIPFSMKNNDSDLECCANKQRIIMEKFFSENISFKLASEFHKIFTICSIIKIKLKKEKNSKSTIMSTDHMVGSL